MAGTGKLLFATLDGTYGDASELVFFTRAELGKWAAESEDPDEFEDEYGEELWEIAIERTGRTPGVPQSVLDEVL